jgi:16S rRNA (cytosine1402-N4)-methyltransferase
MTKLIYHNPVLLAETVAGLDIKPNGVYVDVTFGGGGHSREILKHLDEDGQLFAFDQDKDALENAIDDERFTLIGENFRYMNRFLRFYGVTKVDGILGDFGVSSHQFDVADRGFSTRFDAVLDMRMNQSDKLTAHHIVNKYSDEQLSTILFQYGELRNSRGIAAEIIRRRNEQEIKTSQQLRDAIAKFLPTGREHKVMAQLFQAIRIEVNQEIAALKEFLLQTPKLLKPKGRLSVISYHSLEDRLVKRFIRSGLFEGEPEQDMFGNISVPLKKIGKLIVPSQEEIRKNNRARSAKLRIATKL